jgi:hypothetical protein
MYRNNSAPLTGRSSAVATSGKDPEQPVGLTADIKTAHGSYSFGMTEKVAMRFLPLLLFILAGLAGLAGLGAWLMHSGSFDSPHQETQSQKK